MLTDDDIREIARIATRDYMGRQGLYGEQVHDDVYADALYGIAQALRRMVPGRSHSEYCAYALRRARGEIIDSLRERYGRSEKQRAQSQHASLEEMHEEDHWDPVEPRQPLGDIEYAEDLGVALAAMSVREREVFIQHEAYGIHLAEIGSWYGLTGARVSQIKQAACEQGRRALLAAQAA